MSRLPGELPPDLGKVAFTVEQGRRLGLTRRRMRAADLDRPFRGVRQTAQADPTEGASPELGFAHAELLERCAAAGLVVPSRAFFCHITAARLWPLPLPLTLPDGPLHVGVMSPEHPPRRTGVVGHHVSDPAAFTVVRNGHSLIDPGTLFCQLSVLLRLEDLIAVGDALVLKPRFCDEYDERPWLTPRELTDRVERFRGRGKSRAAQAVGLVRPGAESRPESLVRLALLAAGLPEPEVNVDVFSDRGAFIGRGDLVYRRFRVVAEYDGDQHRTNIEQYDRDIDRLDDFARHGWRVVRITGRAFFGDRACCIARVEQALAAAGWRRPT